MGWAHSDSFQHIWLLQNHGRVCSDVMCLRANKPRELQPGFASAGVFHINSLDYKSIFNPCFLNSRLSLMESCNFINIRVGFFNAMG